MDLDIEMDVDDVQDVPVPTIPAAYTEDVVAEDEQVRIGGSIPTHSHRAMR